MSEWFEVIKHVSGRKLVFIRPEMIVSCIKIIKPILSQHEACRVQPLLNKTQKRNSFTNKYKHGPTKLSNPDPDYVQWFKEFFTKEAILEVARDTKRILWDDGLERTQQKVYRPDELCIIEHFDSMEAIKKWKPVADSDSFNGYSVSNVSFSKAGHALFHGVLDNRVPEDGVTHVSGFAGLMGPRRRRRSLFSTEAAWDWEQFNSVEIRYRGDGRKYSFIVNTACYNNDLTYYDFYGYPLYTRGGPYWQTTRIPFSKLVFANKGLIQDFQAKFPKTKPKFVAITLQDTYNGPFALEIDYIALLTARMPFEEDSAYEGYKIAHIRWRDVSPGCDPPEHRLP